MDCNDTKSNVIGKVSTQLGVTVKKSMPQRYYLGRSDEGIKVNLNSDTFQERKKTPMKDNLEIIEVETKLNSNWLRPNIKEKDIDKVQCEELTNSNKRKWRKEIISNTFTMVDAGKILRLPLDAIPQEDEDRLEENGLTKAPIRDSWVLPSGEDIKINFDAGFNRDFFRLRSGIVSRNKRGRVIASRATIHENVDSTFAAEAHSCLEAVRMGLAMKERRIYIERD
ncbi:hypothetical protein Golax_010671 [Gossypium laxum]|uniref:RNase H type-1 domain-containing protein n=1 Tax=Gossypium laxum TaxID=34288 RepID=A0A7J8ZI95_9ROSI|nr:hypothetical protein [Gossypium laxum]